MSTIQYRPGYENKAAYALSDVDKAKYIIDTPKTFHRLNKQPLDVSVTFDSINELYDYIKSDAWYDGQIVSVKISPLSTTRNLYMQRFKIQNGVAFPILDNGEAIIKNFGNVYKLLIYYKKANSTQLFRNIDNLMSLSMENGIYSILPLLDIFILQLNGVNVSIYENNSLKYNFYQFRSVLDYTELFDYDDEVGDGAIHFSTQDVKMIGQLSYYPDEESGYNIEDVSYILPKTQNSNEVKIYVDITSLISKI